MLTKDDKARFETIERAFRNGDVALMDCADAATGESVAVMCAINRNDDGSFEFVPFAKLLRGNPYEQLVPPTIEEIH